MKLEEQKLKGITFSLTRVRRKKDTHIIFKAKWLKTCQMWREKWKSKFMRLQGPQTVKQDRAIPTQLAKTETQREL